MKRAVLVLLAPLLFWAVATGLAREARAAGPALPVAVYVNVDEMSTLWDYRDAETGAFPEPGDARYDEYSTQWKSLIELAFREIRRRTPGNFMLFPSTAPDEPHAIRITVWIADLATSCNAPTYYKYLWARTPTVDEEYTTNWDGLGVRSDTLIDSGMPKPQRARADLEGWAELWSQVPYLHVRKLTEEEVRERAAEAEAESGAGADGGI